jgi:uncharacterized protein YndB with AHSA1/START domain
MNETQAMGTTPPDVGIDERAPVISRHETSVHAPAEVVWRILTDVDAWPTWRPGVPRARLETSGPLVAGSIFHWAAPGMEIVSTVVEVRPLERLVWHGTGNGEGGVFGVSAWTLAPTGSGVVVSAEESFTGPPVDAAPAQLQAALDEGLARTLQRLKNVAEEN